MLPEFFLGFWIVVGDVRDAKVEPIASLLITVKTDFLLRREGTPLQVR